MVAIFAELDWKRSASLVDTTATETTAILDPLACYQTEKWGQGLDRPVVRQI